MLSLGITYATMGEAYFKAGNYSQALSKFSKSKNIFVDINYGNYLRIIDEFINNISACTNDIGIEDDFLLYCKNNPTYDEAMEKYIADHLQAHLICVNQYGPAAHPLGRRPNKRQPGKAGRER